MYFISQAPEDDVQWHEAPTPEAAAASAPVGLSLVRPLANGWLPRGCLREPMNSSLLARFGKCDIFSFFEALHSASTASPGAFPQITIMATDGRLSDVAEAEEAARHREEQAEGVCPTGAWRRISSQVLYKEFWLYVFICFFLYVLATVLHTSKIFSGSSSPTPKGSVYSG